MPANKPKDLFDKEIAFALFCEAYRAHFVSEKLPVPSTEIIEKIWTNGAQGRCHADMTKERQRRAGFDAMDNAVSSTAQQFFKEYKAEHPVSAAAASSAPTKKR